MREAVARQRRAVGQRAHRRRREQRALPRELVARPLDRRGRHLERVGDHRRGEVAADEARRLEHELPVRVEPLHLLLDEPADRRGHDARDVAERTREPPAIAVVDDGRRREQLVDEAHQEERVAVAAAVDDGRELRRERVPREARVEVRRDVARGEVPERDLLARRAGAQLAHHAPQRVLARRGVDRTVAAEHQQPRRVGAAREHRDEIERRVVAPVQVLEHQHEDLLRAHHEQHVGHLAQHALGRAAEQLARGNVALAQRGR
ncbi:MAG: hypothetical protein AB1689_04655, partial [Thermodesulfobacteriota bacterium]